MTPDLIETVRVRMLKIYQRDRLLYADIARKTGYATRTIAHFMRREELHQSSNIAEAIVRAYPETGEGMICPYCGSVTDDINM